MTDREKLDRLFETIYAPAASLRAEAFRTAEPVPFARRTEGERIPCLRPGDRWGSDWDCAWIRLSGVLPEHPAHPENALALLLDAGGEACLYDENGRALKGFTNVQSEFTVALGKPGKTCLFLPRTLYGKEISWWADCGANDLFGAKPENGVFVRALIAECNVALRGLFYDLDVLCSLAETGNAEAKELFGKAYALRDEPERARALTAPFFGRKRESRDAPVYAVGNAHIDLAWLWPMRETRRKAVRTLATVCELMERYPAYRFSVSQPQMLEWVEEDAPELFARVKALADAGRIELLGGMWVEPDTNLPGGESLVRQLLYGISYSEKIFGQKQTFLALPDSFGFCAQLPQLLRGAGMDAFLTTKLSWNAVNRFPHDSFRWRGADGSEVTAHIPPEGNYNSAALPASIRKAKGKGGFPSALLYGIGDGGGGPGMEHPERLAREACLPGLPEVKNGSVGEFFADLKRYEKELPVWEGELYLEKHQGVYTTFAKLKDAMAECEDALRRAELCAALAARLGKLPEGYREQAERLWKGLLLLQFHDILPGSCIRRACDESLRDCEALRDEAKELAGTLCALLTDAGEQERIQKQEKQSGNGFSLRLSPYCAKNDPSPGGKGIAILPGNGFADPPRPTESREAFLQNGFLRADFLPDGGLSQVTDLQTGETFLREKAELRFYADGENAWEIPDVREAPYETWEMTGLSLGRETRSFRLRKGENAADVTIRLAPGSKRLEFEVKAVSFPLHTLAKWAFPLRHRSENALCGIQFGAVRRPTTSNHSHDAAMKEVCFRRFVDISDDEWGASLLSASRHGCSVKDCVLAVSLLRSPDYPAFTDCDGVVSRFAFFPHRSGAEAIFAEAGDYCFPPLPLPGTPLLSGTLFCLPGMEIETVKPAEDPGSANGTGPAIVLRACNPRNAYLTTRLTVHPGLRLQRMQKTDLRERNAEPLPFGEPFTVRPFGIVTLLLS